MLSKILKWCKDNDWVVLLPSGLLLLTLLVIARLWWWLGFVSTVIALVLIFEVMASHFTGLSISDQFRTWKVKRPVLSKFILFAWAAFAASLIFHLSLPAGG